ncbi:hypothetical protein D3C72_2108880 [compost metagenome]
MDFTVATHGYTAHVFSTARHHDVGGTRGNCTGGQVDRDFTRTAFTVDGQPGNGDRPAGPQQRRTGDVGGLFTDLRYAAKDHVVHRGRRYVDALQQTTDHQ